MGTFLVLSLPGGSFLNFRQVNERKHWRQCMAADTADFVGQDGYKDNLLQRDPTFRGLYQIILQNH